MTLSISHFYQQFHNTHMFKELDNPNPEWYELDHKESVVSPGREGGITSLLSEVIDEVFMFDALCEDIAKGEGNFVRSGIKTFSKTKGSKSDEFEAAWRGFRDSHNYVAGSKSVVAYKGKNMVGVEGNHEAPAGFTRMVRILHHDPKNKVNMLTVFVDHGENNANSKYNGKYSQITFQSDRKHK